MNENIKSQTLLSSGRFLSLNRFDGELRKKGKLSVQAKIIELNIH